MLRAIVIYWILCLEDVIKVFISTKKTGKINVQKPINPISDSVCNKSECAWTVNGMYCWCAFCKLSNLALVISEDWKRPLIVLYESTPYPQNVFIWIWLIISFQRWNLNESPVNKSLILFINNVFVKIKKTETMEIIIIARENLFFATIKPDDARTVSYTHLTLPTNREV